MAAGTSSRFVPLSVEKPKGLLEVKGEILIERQIRQLQDAGIDDITIVVGYKAELFKYLQDKFGVNIVYNEDYSKYNNTSSVIRVLDKLGDTFVCSSDNYFPQNVFTAESPTSYYSALYAEGATNEYCLQIDANDNIRNVTVGGKNAWYMVGHVYFNKDFSQKFKEILAKEYQKEITRQEYWEDVFIRYIDQLPLMKINRYAPHAIEEFDSLDELRAFDKSYIEDTRSTIIKNIAKELCCKESALTKFKKISHCDEPLAFEFEKDGDTYLYSEACNSISKI